jgi:15-cis-phytoene synthase
MSSAVSGADGSRESAAFCADLVRGHDFVRYASTLFMPADQRRALLALYAFNVEIRRVRDQISQPLPGEIRLQWWTDMLAGQVRDRSQDQDRDQDHGGAEGNPVAAELLRAIGEYRLPAEPLSRLIEEHQFDLYNDPMPTLAALEGYLTDTSSVLFGLAARIAGPASAEVEHLARHAGLAQGFNDVIVALPRDASRRQLFLPLQLLESHGGAAEEVFSGKLTPNTRAALQQLVGGARGHLQTALSLLAEVAPHQRPVFLPLSLLRRDLDRVLRADADPFAPKMRSRLSILWTLWRASRSEPFKAG